MMDLKSFVETGIPVNLDVLPEDSSIRAFDFPVRATIHLLDGTSDRVQLPKGIYLVVTEYKTTPETITYLASYLVSEESPRRGFPIDQAPIRVPRNQDPPAQARAVQPRRVIPVDRDPVSALTVTRRPGNPDPLLSTGAQSIRFQFDLELGSQGLATKDNHEISHFGRCNLWFSDHFGLTGEASILPQDGSTMHVLGLEDQERRLVAGLAYRNSWLDRLALLYGQVEDSTGNRVDAYQVEVGVTLLGIRNLAVGKHTQRSTEDVWLRSRSEFDLKSWGRTRLSLGGEYLAENYKLILLPGAYSEAKSGDRFNRTRGSGFMALYSVLGPVPFRIYLGAGQSSRKQKFIQAEVSIGRF